MEVLGEYFPYINQFQLLNIPPISYTTILVYYLELLTTHGLPRAAYNSIAGPTNLKFLKIMQIVL